jgi:hypothetical protein
MWENKDNRYYIKLTSLCFFDCVWGPQRGSDLITRLQTLHTSCPRLLYLRKIKVNFFAPSAEHTAHWEAQEENVPGKGRVDLPCFLFFLFLHQLSQPFLILRKRELLDGRTILRPT